MRSRIVVTIALLVILVYTASSQEHRKATTSPTATIGAGMTREQADAILSELKSIHQLLEKQQGARGAVPAAPPAPEKVQMSLGADWHSIGKDDAPVTLVEFADFQCPYCRKFQAETFSELKKNYIDTGKVRFISRDLPLDFHPYSMKAAEASRCAGDQDKYWEMRNALIENAAKLSDDLMVSLAQSAGVNMDLYQACISSHRHQQEVQKDAAAAATLAIGGTPSFVLAKTSKEKLDGVKLVGAMPYGQFQAAIEHLLSN